MSQPPEEHVQLAQITDGAWAGWSRWPTDEPYEDHVGPFYARRDVDGRMICGCDVGPANVRSGEIAHGGFLMSFADYSLFLIAHDALAGADGVTVSLTSDFLAAAPIGSSLIARGEVMKAGGSLIFVRGQIEIARGGAAALAFSGVIKRLRARPKPFAR